MSYTYGTHGARLMAENVSPDHFGGFVTAEPLRGTETLYAVDRQTGAVFTRTDSIGNTEFDGNDWTPCASVPDHADWIGNYPAPKARIAQLKQAGAPTIKLTGAIGGFQE